MFQEVLDKVWFIQGNNTGRYPYSNSLFINDRKKLLIDTGIGRSVIKKFLKQFGQPDIILYSHAHEDHIYDTSLFTSLRYIHERDKLVATSKDELYRVYGVNTGELREILDIFFKSLHYQPLIAVNTFTHDQVFDLGTIQVKVIHAPGHSAGHSCFEVLNEDLIFSSDIDLTSFGPWYGALDASIQDFEQSIKALIKRSPKLLITSHKGIISNEIKSQLQKFLDIITERDVKILEFLQKERTLEETIPQALIHGKFTEPIDYYIAAERIMLEKHLAILLANHKIEQKNGRLKAL
ncbi:MAG TPA: MBL fold metallo-hydrolase [Candidatus Deferrimicrobium sp.]|nr:MBL fold metallo-hydrolase [Candidatus Deferrimicrobium sp.]